VIYSFTSTETGFLSLHMLKISKAIFCLKFLEIKLFMSVFNHLGQNDCPYPRKD